VVTRATGARAGVRRCWRSPEGKASLIETIPLTDITHAEAEASAQAEQHDSAPAQAPDIAAVVPDEAPPLVAAPVVADPVVAAPVGEAEESASAWREAAALESGFAPLGLSAPILRAVTEKGYLTPTPIQEQAIPWVLMGRDLLGCAQTGTGKTAGFTLPMLDILSGSRARARMPRSLILEPTRELALQVAENFIQYGKYLKLNHALIIGGESMSDQRELLMRGVDVLIATPGRLIDMFERGGLLLTDTRVLVIDEADRMLDMGFIPDVERIVALLPKTRQTMFFSATMAPEIRRLADAFLQNPKEITVSKPATVATTITEAMALVAEHDKREALRRLVRSEDVQNALIFCNRKRDVDILYKSLTRHNFSVGALHGDMSQPVRFATLEKFKSGDIRLLCCSDVAARGLDIGGLSHVFNFDVPIHAEDYVHRIGRTGRAGNEGRAFTLATSQDRLAVEAIQKLTGHPIPRIDIDGLDTVEWAEGDGRKRRGRKAAEPKRSAARKDEAAKPARREPKPKAEPVAARAPAEAAVAAPAAPQPRPAEPKRRDDRRRAGPAPEPRVETRPDRDRPDRDRPDRDRPERRDRDRDRRRDDDFGPTVVGFGTDIPAFMLVAARPRRAHGAAADLVTADHREG
jgi:superfamily II DNA/RNA helicase